MLVYARSPDGSRGVDWQAPPGFEIVREARGEVVRRRDGIRFDRVTLTMAPAYRDLPKEYAPFSPFGDGGMLFHSGRFFACIDTCADDARWSMTVRTDGGRAVVLDGRRQAGRAAWIDRDGGRNIYIGRAVPVATPDLMAVIDHALPAAIRTRLEVDMPRFMRFFAARLGALPTRPLLFASYDAGHRPGWGRQGGPLPGQVFTHFYGAGWSAEMARPNFTFDLAWHFAHEAGHLYQRGVALGGPGGAWAHEGAAEAFALLALRALDPSYVALAEAKVADARSACTKARAGRSLVAAIDAGAFAAAYSCGLVLNLAIHDAALRANPGSEGLFGFWRRIVMVALGTAPWEGRNSTPLSRPQPVPAPRARWAVRSTPRRPRSTWHRRHAAKAPRR